MSKMNKVMIVDDSRMILKISKDIIEKNLTECEVDSVLDAEEAKMMLLGKQYEVVILDIVMPKISGIDVLKWIKEQAELKHLKVIMFTSLNDSDALSQCFQLGAYDFISKPLEENEFIARLMHAMNEYAQEAIIRDNFKKLQELNENQRQLNRSLKETQAELVQKDRLASVGHLAAGMAHELNNPLGFLSSNISTMDTNIQSMLDLYKTVSTKLRESELSEELMTFIEQSEREVDLDFIVEDSAELIADIKHGLNRIHSIVEALRKFSVDDSGDDLEPIVISEILDNILTMVREKTSNIINIEKTIEAHSTVVAKKADFNMSILALIDNAIHAVKAKHSLKAGTIKIHLYEEGTEVHLVIEDNGVGMKKDVLKQAMDPFFTTRDVGEGVGLGLSAAYNSFVKLMKGTMVIESEYGDGTRIHLSLPKGEE